MENLNGLPPVSNDSLIKIEESLGFKLPVSLKELYTSGNKYTVGEWEFYPVKDEKFLNKTWDDILRANTIDREEYPSSFFIIADNGTGDKLGYKLNESEEIFLWDHEEEELYSIADSLKEFIENEVMLSESMIRADDFLDTVKDEEIVYGLSKSKENGWAYAPSKHQDTDVLLFFSTEEFAQKCKKAEWSNYHLITLSLEIFTDRWLPNMINDNLLCGLDWDDDLNGVELSPENILNDILND